MFKSGIPLKVAIGLAVAIALDTSLQLAWKFATSQLPSALSLPATAEAALQQPIFAGVALLMILQLVNWLNVLGHADLSFAQPITSLSYVSVCVLSAIYLGEALDLLQIGGIALILVGVWFISRTGHATSAVKVLQP